MLDACLITWLRISRTHNIGPISFHSLFRRFTDPTEALEFIAKKSKAHVAEEYKVLEEIEQTHKFGAKIVFFKDEMYPASLRQVRDAPPFIVVKGNLAVLSNPIIAIVGSRNSSIQGNKIAYNLGKGLTNCGYSIVSGMARGIDRYAHLGAMQSNIAVMACGIDQVYPQENRDIYDKIVENGLVITESPIGTPPASHLFPGRNRIVAGMSVATIVVEATKHSGSLITAECALDYGREVFAVPGCPLDPRAFGTNRLIQTGAYLVQDYNDVLQQLGSAKVEDQQHPDHDSSGICDGVCENDILSLLSASPIAIDEIHSHLTCSIAELRRALVRLEIDGRIQHLPGDKVNRVYT